VFLTIIWCLARYESVLCFALDEYVC